jgi:hypothetical protein
MTRREFLAGSGLALSSTKGLLAQQSRGMASRGVKPSPRSKPSGLPFHSRLTNVAAHAGLRAPIIYGEPGKNSYIVESMGCGAAFIDFDNDGWLDIVTLTGRRFVKNPADAVIRLYRNNRDGTFADVTAKSGLGRSVWACGVTVGDYDNDGFDDLFITCWGQNILFHNNGDGTFTDATAKAGLLDPSPRFATGSTWVDYDRDGKLDLFVCHYAVLDLDKAPAAGKDPTCNWKGVAVYCGPVGLPEEPCRLYHNNGDGTFTDVSKRAGISTVKPGHALTAIATDLDGDGWPDIYVACDTSPSLLFRNNRDGTFREAGVESGAALNEDGMEQAGMGVGVGDYNNDGYLDLLKTHFADDTPVLYQGNGNGFFRDMTAAAGLGVETRYVGWGAGIADLDNDGLPDLFLSTGMVYPELEARFPEYAWKTPAVLFRNLGSGRFEELGDQAGPALLELHCSRGVAFGDFDNDGDLDILIVNLNEPPSLLRNDQTPRSHWIKVLLMGVKSNRSAIGAQVTVSYEGRKQVQAVLAQSSYLSANDRRLHFGLGSSATVNIDILWPNGNREKIQNVAADRLVVIREGSGIVRAEAFGG